VAPEARELTDDFFGRTIAGGIQARDQFENLSGHEPKLEPSETKRQVRFR